MYHGVFCFVLRNAGGLFLFAQQNNALCRVLVDGAHDRVGQIRLLQIGHILRRQPNIERGRSIVKMGGLGGPDDGGRNALGHAICCIFTP
mgnify:FL=1